MCIRDSSNPVGPDDRKPRFCGDRQRRRGLRRWQRRAGDTPDPDKTWSGWTPAQDAKVASPPARFLQYRARLRGDDTTLRTIEVFYKTRNQPPVVAIAAPQSGDVWRGTKTLRWSGTDPDRDTLNYEVELSSDGGKTCLLYTSPSPRDS